MRNQAIFQEFYKKLKGRTVTDTLLDEIIALREQVKKLTKERETLTKTLEFMEHTRDVEHIRHREMSTAKREQLAALEEQNEKLRETLTEAKSMVGHPDNIAIINSAISLPNLATPVLNRILAEGMRMAAEICEEIDNDEHLEMSIVCAEAIRAKADEMEQSK